jgi:hypothetical protein
MRQLAAAPAAAQEATAAREHPSQVPVPLAFCAQGEQGHQSEHDQGRSEARHVGSGWQSRERGERSDGRVRAGRWSCGCELM